MKVLFFGSTQIKHIEKRYNSVMNTKKTDFNPNKDFIEGFEYKSLSKEVDKIIATLLNNKTYRSTVMIKSRKDYREYVREDRMALGRENRRFPLTLFDLPLRYQLALRRAEYYNNCWTHKWQRPIVLFFKL